MEPTEELFLDLYEEVDLNGAQERSGGHENELCRPATAKSIIDHRAQLLCSEIQNFIYAEVTVLLGLLAADD